jgi:hypothetical protein
LFRRTDKKARKGMVRYVKVVLINEYIIRNKMTVGQPSSEQLGAYMNPKTLTRYHSKSPDVQNV